MYLTIAFLISLLPGVLTWWWGRALVARMNEPALPERLMAFRLRRARLTFIAVVTAGFLSGNIAPLFILVAAAGVLICSFPARRTLFSEKWGFFSYLNFQSRLAVLVAGFWFAILLVPGVLLSVRGYWWPAAAVLGLLLALWNLFFREIVCTLFRAIPLDRADLAPLFAETNARASARPRRVYKAGPPNGVWANAFAVPSLFGSAVFISETILETFDPQETAAIYAHEVAHIEYYSKKVRTLVSVLMSWVLIALAIAFSRYLLSQADETAAVAMAAWYFLIYVSIALKLARHKTHETESDRRAAELCGNPEALTRALEKLHVLNLMPRRWEPGMERFASHPSLAHRLQDLRGTVAPAAENNQTLVAGTAADGTWAILEATRIHWLRGVPPDVMGNPESMREKAAASESIIYSEITDLRISTKWGGEAALVAADRRGRKWKVPIRSEEVAPVQAFLDTVDARFARAPAKTGKMSNLTSLCILASAATALIGHVISFAFFVSAIIALIRLYPGPVAAFGALSLGAALIEIAHAGFRSGSVPLTQIALLLIAGVGIGCIIAAFNRAPADSEARSRGAFIAAAILGTIALLSGAVAATAGFPGFARFHQMATLLPGFSLALLGTAGALLFVPRRKTGRVAAIALIALAILTFLAGTNWFPAHFTDEDFRGNRPTLVK